MCSLQAQKTLYKIIDMLVPLINWEVCQICLWKYFEEKKQKIQINIIIVNNVLKHISTNRQYKND